MEKPFRSFEEQVQILRKRGMVVNEEEAIRVLSNDNYYNVINGYKDLFLYSKVTENEEEKYKKNTKFSEVYSLYKFDCELKSILLKNLLRIENSFKTKIAYNFSEKYGVKNSIIIENFDLVGLAKRESIEERYASIINLITKIQSEISRQLKGNSSIKHYMVEYGYVPLWVTMNVLTFGTTSLFFRYMKQQDKQKIAKEYKVPEVEIEIILKILSLVRNLCAHDERLYNFKPANMIKGNWVHISLSIPKDVNGYIHGRKDLFAVLICMRLILDSESMSKLVKDIQGELDVLSESLEVININDVLSVMGFPEYWTKIGEV